MLDLQDTFVNGLQLARFTKGIQMQRGKLFSWAAPPLEWIRHNGGIYYMGYSPNSCYIAIESSDKTIQIWDCQDCMVLQLASL